MKPLAAVPLFEEIPMSPTTRIPLGAPPAYRRVVLDRAGGQCECKGECGVAHIKSAGRCPRRHGGWYAKHEVVLLLRPKPAGLLLSLTAQVQLPDAKLMAWCEDCLKKAEKLAGAR